MANTVLLLAASLLLLTSSDSRAIDRTSTSGAFPVVSGLARELHDLSAFSPVRERLGLEAQRGSWPALATDRLDTMNVLSGMLNQTWDTMFGDWFNVANLQSEFDGQGREIVRVTSFWFMNAWTPQQRFERSFDANGRLRRILFRHWNGGTWVNGGRDSIFYNPEGDVIEERVDFFNGASWTPNQRWQVTYDVDRRPVAIVTCGWNGSSWVNQLRLAFTYDGDGNRTEALNQTWAGSDWAGTKRETYTYDANDHPTSRVSQYWSSGAWANDSMATWTWDENQFLVQELDSRWSGSAWTDDILYSFTNGMTGDPEVIMQQFWDGFIWRDEMITYITYDGESPVEELVQRWDGATWANYQKNTLTWQQLVTSLEVTVQCPVGDAWNMVSVPLDVADNAKSAVFPAAVSNAFGFEAGYSSSATLERGRGYWLKFDGAQDVPIVGLPVTADTFAVSAGWNMVGTIGVPVAAVSVASIPDGIVSSNFFGFDNGYATAATLEPGKGYWVKFSQAGQIILNGSGNTPVASRLRMELDGELPPPPPDDAPATSTLPVSTELGQNYPNPFNPVTTIGYSLAAPGRVVIAVYNALGQEVARLMDGLHDAGERVVTFDASAFPSGVYTCRISAGEFTQSRKMLLVK